MRVSKNKILWLLPLFFVFSFVLKAQMVVSGTVNDPDGFPISDVMVELTTNSEISTLTDLDGNYSLSIPESAAVDGKVTVRYSSIEFNEQTVTYDYQEGQASHNFSFSSDTKSLTDVVAVGYGKIRKELATSAVDVVNSEDFNKGYVTNADQLIQGKVSGVQITNNGGTPQGGSTVRIRGGSSLSADSAPLIIIDGLPLDTKQGVTFLNPNDIESVSVLKDAAATAIYGTRGANGVIIYTTKRGSKSGTKVNYNSQYSFNQVPYKYNNLSASELINLITTTDWTLYPNMTDPNGRIGVLNTVGDPTSGRTVYDTDWMDLILKKSFSTNQNISLSGNLFNRIPTRLSTGYTGNNGLLLTSAYQRWTVSAGLSPSFFDNSLKLDVNMNTTSEKFNFADEGQIGNAFTFDPTKPVRYDGLSFGNGYYEWANETNGNVYGLAPANPYAALAQTDNKQYSHRYFGNIQLDYTLAFFKDIRLVVNGGFDQDIWHGINNKKYGARNSYSPSTNVYLGSMENFNGYRQNKSLDTYFVYNHDFNDLDLEFTGGYSWQKFYSRDLNTGNALDPTTATPRTNYDSERNYTTLGYFGRLGLNYLQKYLFNANLRYDATSRFSKDNRWEAFPGLSFAWVMSKEDFLSSVDFVNNLKLRLSFGKTGNQSMPSYLYISSYYDGNEQSSYPFGSTNYPALYPTYYDVNLKWETTKDWNVGFDYSLWNKRISGSLDFYNKKTDDLLAYVNIAPGANFANQNWTNKGTFTNKGFEFLVDFKAIDKVNSDLSFAYTFAYNHRNVKSLGDGGQVEVGGIGGLIGQTITYNEEGYSPNSFYVYKQIYDANGKPIEGAYADRNGDGNITPDDRYYYKNPWPKYIMGFNTTYNYKAFNFSMNWRAHIGNYIYNNLKASNTFLSNVPANGDWITNVTSDYFENGFIQKDVETMQSDYFIENGSFLKLDNLTLGYTFLNTFGDNSSFNITLSGNNLLIITKSDAKDPEVYNGIYNTLYPRARTYVLGLNFNF